MTESASARMLRVDQAGEYGAARIYAGQLGVLGDRRPISALQPFWDVAGFALGAATALIGPKAAMACTAAVETEIDLHYSQQLEELGEDDPELSALIEQFRDDDRAHRDAALAAGAEEAPAYGLLSGAIRLGCRVAIKLAEKI